MASAASGATASCLLGKLPPPSACTAEWRRAPGCLFAHVRFQTQFGLHRNRRLLSLLPARQPAPQRAEPERAVLAPRAAQRVIRPVVAEAPAAHVARRRAGRGRRRVGAARRVQRDALRRPRRHVRQRQPARGARGRAAPIATAGRCSWSTAGRRRSTSKCWQNCGRRSRRAPAPPCSRWATSTCRTAPTRRASTTRASRRGGRTTHPRATRSCTPSSRPVADERLGRDAAHRRGGRASAAACSSATA